MANNPTSEKYEQLKSEMEQTEQKKKRFKVDEQIKQKDQEWFDQERKRLEEKIEQNKQLLMYYKLNTSIEGIWENDDNTNFVLYKYGGSLVKSEIDPMGLPASAVEVDFPLVAPILDSKILRTACSLLAAFEEVDKHGCRVQSYGNEADVRGSVHSALMDALKILNGLQGDEDLLTAGHECGIFSNMPDHLVVRVGSLQTPIFVVETKLMNNMIDDDVWGQIYDYHGIMRVVGHCNPFVVLSTFEQSWVTWVESNETCAQIAATTDEEVRFKALKEAKYRFSPQPVSGKPLPVRLDETADVVQNCNTSTTSQKTDRTERRLCRSKPCKSNHLVKLFVNAIACSLSNFHGSASVVRNDQGYQLTDKHVLTLTQENYSFETISLQVMPGEFQSSNFVHQSGFHILDILGSGRTSKAFLATTVNGHECVLKMYIRKGDEGENYQPIDTEEFIRDAKTSTANEEKMYKLIYSMTIPVIELFEHMCLVLPYFRPVQEDEREDAIEDLRKLLRQNFRVQEQRSTIYYKFSEYDQSWRHCGYLCKNQEKTFMVFDLADLETCETEDEHNRYIESHIDKLRGITSASVASSS